MIKLEQKGGMRGTCMDEFETIFGIVLILLVIMNAITALCLKKRAKRIRDNRKQIDITEKERAGISNVI